MPGDPFILSSWQEAIHRSSTTSHLLNEMEIYHKGLSGGLAGEGETGNMSSGAFALESALILNSLEELLSPTAPESASAIPQETWPKVSSPENVTKGKFISGPEDHHLHMQQGREYQISSGSYGILPNTHADVMHERQPAALETSPFTSPHSTPKPFPPALNSASPITPEGIDLRFISPFEQHDAEFKPQNLTFCQYLGPTSGHDSSDGPESLHSVPSDYEAMQCSSSESAFSEPSSLPENCFPGFGGRTRPYMIPFAQSSNLGARADAIDALGSSLGHEISPIPVPKQQRTHILPVQPQRMRRYSASSASGFCHICARSARVVRLAKCANVEFGLCRKTVCNRCFREQNWNWELAMKKPDTFWCSHCLSVCPPNAQCRTYQKTNERRRQQCIQKRLQSAKSSGYYN